MKDLYLCQVCALKYGGKRKQPVPLMSKLYCPVCGRRRLKFKPSYSRRLVQVERYLKLKNKIKSLLDSGTLQFPDLTEQIINHIDEIIKEV